MGCRLWGREPINSRQVRSHDALQSPVTFFLAFSCILRAVFDAFPHLAPGLSPQILPIPLTLPQAVPEFPSLQGVVTHLPLPPVPLKLQHRCCFPEHCAPGCLGAAAGGREPERWLGDTVSCRRHLWKEGCGSGSGRNACELLVLHLVLFVNKIAIHLLGNERQVTSLQ